MGETTTSPKILLSASGTMRLTVDGHDVAFSSRKALAMLVYLALQPGRSESRERVAALLWSDSGGEQSRGALRQTLRRMKQDLGPAEDLIDADRTMLRLKHPVRLDILDAIDAAARCEAPSAFGTEEAGLDRLFVDLEDLDPDFNLWITVQRERLGAALLERLEAALKASVDDTARLAVAEALLRTDPTHEGACRAAMQAHLALGDTAHAMRCYERLWHVLEDELDVEPSEKTQGLYVAIKQGQVRPALRDSVPAAPDLLAPIAIIVEPTAAQLPEELDYFGEIFRDEMIAALSRFRDWLVVDGERGGPTPPTYRAYALRILLHGGEGGVMAALRLINQSDSRTIWAERYTVTLDGMAALHRTALRQLSLALNVHLSATRLQNVREAASPMGRKYELWMQAQALMGEWRPDSEDRAEAILRGLIADAPGFAPAMMALAQLINAAPIVYPGRLRNAHDLKECLDLTARAVNLDPLDSRTHLCRAWAHAIAGAHGAALSHLDLALDLNENDPWTIISAGLGYAFAGEQERARKLVSQARSFGMRHSRAAQGYVATAAFLIGDFEGSVTAADVAGDAIINLPAWQAASLMHMRRPQEAANAMDRFLTLARASWTGDAHPEDGEVLDWFMGCFPIRSQEVRANLRDSLTDALREKVKRLG